MIRSAPTGTPDILGIQRRTVERRTVTNPGGFNPVERLGQHTYGQAIAIETKSTTGTQQREQADFQTAWESMGGIYILARSVDDVLAVLGPDPVAGSPFRPTVSLPAR